MSFPTCVLNRDEVENIIEIVEGWRGHNKDDYALVSWAYGALHNLRWSLEEWQRKKAWLEESKWDRDKSEPNEKHSGYWVSRNGYYGLTELHHDLDEGGGNRYLLGTAENVEVVAALLTERDALESEVRRLHALIENKATGV